MVELNWETQITMSVSDNMTMFKTAKLPFKNVLKVACTNGVMYCASTFREEKRDYAHWNNGAQIIVLDFDEGLTELAKSWLQNQFGFLIPTRHHNIAKAGKSCERYRAILLTETPMNITSNEYVRTYQNLINDNNLPGDKSCTDVSRLYYGFSSSETMKDIKILNGKPLDWTKYNYENNVQMVGLPKSSKFVDISEYEGKIDLSNVPNMNHSKRYECPICALEGLDPNKHHLGFSPEKDLLTCFYDKEGHSPILRALYRKQVLGLDPEIDEDCQEIVEEEVKQADGKVKKKRTVKPKMEKCSACNGTGKITCTDCNGTGMKDEQVEGGTRKVPCSHCKGTGFFPCPECQGTGKVPKKPKPRVKKPSLPDAKIPTRPRNAKGKFHFNELGATLDFDAEVAKYEKEQFLGVDVETYFDQEVAITEDEAKEMFKGEYISIAATYKRVVKNFKAKALDAIDNTVRLFIVGTEQHQTAFDLSICTPEQKQKLFTLLKGKVIIGHNFKFDLKSFASTYGMQTLPDTVFDTMLGSKIIHMMHSTFEPAGTNSYGSVVERYCNVKLPKDQGDSDWGQSDLTMEQFVYALNDVKYLIPAFKKMIAILYKEYKTNYVIDPEIKIEELKPLLGDFVNIHPIMAIEMKFLLSLTKMELKGVMVNESAIRDIVKEHLEKIKDAENRLGFNPASNPSCLKFVKQLIGPKMTSASKEALAEYYHIPEIALLGEAKQAKARAGLLVKMYEHKADGRIHPTFTQILATGRLACIADGSKISCVNGLKNIEDVEIGDLVYCYDDKGQVQIRKVLNKYDNGVRECIDIKWQASGTGRIGHLICTPDHKIKTKYKGWQQAKDLKKNDKLYHFSQSVEENEKDYSSIEISDTGFRHVWDLEVEEFHNFIADEICVHNCKEPNMQQVPRSVKDYIYRAPAGRCVFSADYPAIELRLCAVWHKEPAMIEAFKHGEDLHYKMAAIMTGKKIPKTDEEKHDESGAYISKEERTAAKNCFEAGTELLTDKGWIKIEDLCNWIDSDGLYSYTKNEYKAIDPLTSEPIDILYTYKENAKELLDFELEDGSTISVTPEHRMYVKRKGKERIVFAKDVLITDEIIPYNYDNNSVLNIRKISKRKVNEKVYCLKVDNELGIVVVRDKEGHTPIITGQCNFGFIYGAWWTTYQKIQMVKNHLKISDKDARESRESFMKLYRVVAQHIDQTKFEFDHARPRIIEMQDSMGNTYTQQAPYIKEVNTLLGRRLASDTVNTALNYCIQGSGGDIAKVAICMFDDICAKENIDSFIVNMIHDDIVVESAIADKSRAQSALARAMNGAADLVMGHYFKTDVSDEITVFAETPIESKN